MNEEKNNIGVNSNGLPPMGTVFNGSASSQNMNANNLPPMGTLPIDSMFQKSVDGINNNLPPMNSTVTSNVQDKYGLPPISNFTNFDNYNTPKVDSSTSVFDLMEQFDSVNNNLNQEHTVQDVANINNTNPIYQVPNSQNVNTNVIPSIPVMNNSMEANNSVNNVDHTLDIFGSINSLNSVSNQSAIGVNQSNVVIPSVSTTNYVNTPVVPQVNNSTLVSNGVSQSGTASNSPNNILNTQPMNMFSGNNVDVSTNSIQDDVNNNQGISNVQQVLENNPVLVNQQLPTSTSVIPQLNNANTNTNITPNSNQGFINNSDTDFVNVPPTPINNDSRLFTNSENNQGIVVSNEEELETPNNIPPMINHVVDNVNFDGANNDKVVEIPTVSIENEIGTNNQLSVENVIDNANNDPKSESSEIEDLITSIDTDTDNNIIDVNTNNNPNINKDNINDTTNNLVNSGVVNDKPKKKKKILFIILLIFTIIIILSVGVLSYFMFFKTDKLVCGLQDYSNDSYILDESIVFRFKGNKITTANFTQKLTFDSDHLNQKDSYLEELKNQYQGLGFNVSFIENEDGFDINMNFTKKELESWYGNELKNSSKNHMKKEMRESGYTCK